MPIFPDQLNKSQRVSSTIDSNIFACSTTLLRTYNTLRKTVYANMDFKDEYDAYDPDAVYVAFAQYGKSLSPQQLGDAARAIKALLNIFQPGTIVDDVPEATITF